MLHEFLLSERAGIFAMCSVKLASLVGGSIPGGEQFESGLSVFYDELINALQADLRSKDGVTELFRGCDRVEAQDGGRSYFKLGYTISQIVHVYGVLGETITEYCALHGMQVTAREFNRLNLCVDCAIAEGVTEYSKNKFDAAHIDEIQRLGTLAHELRNSLANAMIAHQMIKRGLVGTGGSTERVLENSFGHMKTLIDRTLSEVRLQGRPSIELRYKRLVDLVSEVETTALSEATAKSIRLHVDVSHELYVNVDPHLVVSAISNLVQNAIKFTKPTGNVWIRGRALDDRVVIEVEDQCGGLPPGKIEELFAPYSQKNIDKSGLGLGLTISRRAVAINNGKLTARDLPHRGCVFTIDLPRAHAAQVEEAPMQ